MNRKTESTELMHAIIAPFEKRGVTLEALRRKKKRTSRNTMYYLKIYCYCLRQKTDLSIASISMHVLMSDSQVKLYISQVKEEMGNNPIYNAVVTDILKHIDEGLQ